MNLTGTEKAVRVLKELVAIWDRVKSGVWSVRSIRGSGIAEVKQSPDGVVIHVPGPATEDLDSGTGLIGKWAKLVDYDAIANGQNSYSGDVYRSFDGPAAARTGIAIINSWERENTSSNQAGYEIVTSDPVCGDIIGIEVLPMDEWYLIVGVFEDAGERKWIISQRNDPTIQSA